jgi:hypothetical protein
VQIDAGGLVIVRQIEVEGGFLDGLRLPLEAGLVTVIGSRGTGKTSLIELIRFGLDARRITRSGDPYQQAKAVLDSGQVTLTVDVDGQELRVVRSATDPAPRGLEQVNEPLPLILAQNEIEELGTDKAGQLSLIDGFRDRLRAEESEQARLNDLLRAGTREIIEARAELASLRDQIAGLGDLVAALEEADALEVQLGAGAESTLPIRRQLDAVTEQLSDARVTTDLLRRNLDAAQRWAKAVQAAAESEPPIHPAPNAMPALASGLEARFEEAREALASATSSLARGIAAIELALSAGAEQETALEAQGRELRAQLEALEEGAGVTARRVSELRQRQAFADSLRDLIRQQESALADRLASRDGLIKELQDLHDRRFQDRAHAVQALNATLEPNIRISLTRSGNFEAYSALLVELLSGSRIRYNTLAPALAAQVSPIELARIVEAGDSSTLAAASGIDTDRAARVIGYLGGAGTERLFTAVIDDSVDISLLDGDTYKGSDELSTGQRCTAILPILLARRERGLIVDQPEDHLDNAFVVETVIKALRTRSADAQLIFSSHNANIPVLGEADQIVALDSNGRRGFTKHTGPLDDDLVVSLIKEVMEGGEEAFRARAAFYSAHVTS